MRRAMVNFLVVEIRACVFVGISASTMRIIYVSKLHCRCGWKESLWISCGFRADSVLKPASPDSWRNKDFSPESSFSWDRQSMPILLCGDENGAERLSRRRSAGDEERERVAVFEIAPKERFQYYDSYYEVLDLWTQVPQGPLRAVVGPGTVGPHRRALP